MNDPPVTPEWARPRNCLFTGLVLDYLQLNSLPHSSGSRLPHNPGIPCHLRLLESPFRHHHKVYYSEGRGVGPAKRPLGNGEIWTLQVSWFGGGKQRARARGHPKLGSRDVFPQVALQPWEAVWQQAGWLTVSRSSQEATLLKLQAVQAPQQWAAPVPDSKKGAARGRRTSGEGGRARAGTRS